MEQQNRESMDFEEIVQRAINAEAKAGLRSSTMVRESDARCPRGHRPFYNTSSKMQTQGSSHKDSPRTKESRLQEAKQADGKAPAPPRSESTEAGKTSHIDKKREFLEKKKKKRDWKNNTLATGDNANDVEVGEKKKRDNQGDGRCYNCQKKGHFSRNCPEPPKN